jgi:hypothetical protein
LRYIKYIRLLEKVVSVGNRGVLLRHPNSVVVAYRRRWDCSRYRSPCYRRLTSSSTTSRTRQGTYNTRMTERELPHPSRLSKGWDLCSNFRTRHDTDVVNPLRSAILPQLPDSVPNTPPRRMSHFPSPVCHTGLRGRVCLQQATLFEKRTPRSQGLSGLLHPLRLSKGGNLAITVFSEKLRQERTFFLCVSLLP